MRTYELTFFNISVILCFTAICCTIAVTAADMPLPFKRELSITTPHLQGKDVVILQNLLGRSKILTEKIKPTGFYDNQTALAVSQYKNRYHLPGVATLFDAVAAKLVLKQLSYDGYKDNDEKPVGYKFKIFIPVHRNRSLETIGNLLDSDNKVLYQFKVRAHGANLPDGQARNQFTRNGNTPTGLMKCDLNTKEPNERSFGPYPVVRAVKGLKGNAAIGKDSNDTFLSDYRSGILMHTGEWAHWNPSMHMPNSNGCLHLHPNDMKNLVEILVEKLNVSVNKNPFGMQPYPYQCQGLLSIEQIEHDSKTY